MTDGSARRLQLDSRSEAAGAAVGPPRPVVEADLRGQRVVKPCLHRRAGQAHSTRIDACPWGTVAGRQADAPRRQPPPPLYTPEQSAPPRRHALDPGAGRARPAAVPVFLVSLGLVLRYPGDRRGLRGRHRLGRGQDRACSTPSWSPARSGRRWCSAATCSPAPSSGRTCSACWCWRCTPPISLRAADRRRRRAAARCSSRSPPMPPTSSTPRSSS